MEEAKKFMYILLAGVLMLIALKYNYSRAINMQTSLEGNHSTLVDSLQTTHTHEIPN